MQHQHSFKVIIFVISLVCRFRQEMDKIRDENTKGKRKSHESYSEEKRNEICKKDKVSKIEARKE